MNKKKQMIIVNSLLFVSFVVVATSGMLHDFMPYRVFDMIHPKAGMLMIVLIIWHLALNWSWVKSNILKKK